MSSTKKIKVVRIIARLIIGGPTTHVMGLNLGLDKNYFDQILVYGLENEGERCRADEAISKGLKTVCVPEMVAELSIKPRDMQALIKLYHLLKKEKPDIVHTHTAKAGVWGRIAAKLAGVPVIIHTYHGHILSGYYGTAQNWMLRMMESILGLITTKIIAVSEGVKKDLLRFRIARPSKIKVIPLGLDLSPFRECGSMKGQFKKAHGLSSDIRLVGIVGRMVPIKNHRLFLETAALVASKMPDVRFVIVGDGPLRVQEETRAKTLGIADKVIFTGWQNELAGIYADMDVLVVSSINEGTPVSAIEAMVAGCPVVATRVGGIPDLISDGQTGLLVDSGDTQHLSEEIITLLQDKATYDIIAAAARTAVVEKYSLGRLLNNIGQFYFETIAEKARI